MSAQTVRVILADPGTVEELGRLQAGLATLLADDRLTQPATRQMLVAARSAVTQMIERQAGTEAGSLVALAQWLAAQVKEKQVIEDSEKPPSLQERLVLENPLIAEGGHLTSILKWVLSEYLQVEGEAAGEATLESYLQLYVTLRATVEGSYEMPDWLLLKAPNWIKTRFGQLTAEQKRQFLKDVRQARAEAAAGAGADEVPGEPPSAAQQADYESAYQFIVSNTPASN